MARSAYPTGRYLVKVPGSPALLGFEISGAVRSTPNALGYRRLFNDPESVKSMRTSALTGSGYQWLYGSSLDGKPLSDSIAQAWEAAHDERRKWEGGGVLSGIQRTSIYVEPELANVLSVEPPVELPKEYIDKDFPPSTDEGVNFGPFWHMGEAYANFIAAHEITKGCGVRIGHLDTGYSAIHSSRPGRLLTDLDHDYVDGDDDANDPLTGMSRGHGASTLALLAGQKIAVEYGAQQLVGYVGGAPEAEVISMRIANSVILLPVFLTSAFAQALQQVASLGCQVMSMSMGGYPSAAWADAVNSAYERGVVMVTAAGNHYTGLPPRGVVYPARFDRILAATGCMFDHSPYVTATPMKLQGNFGPASVMEHAVAAYTPNTYWVNVGSSNGYDMNGRGTSAATPQIAAACALWLSRHGRLDDISIPPWLRVEACRLAVFDSVRRPKEEDKPQIGQGALNAYALLAEDRASNCWQKVQQVGYQGAKEASVSFPLFRTLFGLDEPSPMHAMFEMEALHAVLSTTTNDIAEITQIDDGDETPEQKQRLKTWMRDEAPLSNTLRQYIARLN